MDHHTAEVHTQPVVSVLPLDLDIWIASALQVFIRLHNVVDHSM